MQNKFLVVRYLLILCLIFTLLSTNAQNEKPCSCGSELNEAFEARLKGKLYQPLPGLLGSEYFIPGYLNGDIFLEDGQVGYDQQIRYNGRIDELLLLPQNSYKEIILDKYFIKEFSIKDVITGKLNFRKIKVVKEFNSDSVEIFGQVLYQSKLALYAYRRYVFEQEISEYAGGRLIARKSFGPSFIYYFKLPDNKTIGFKSFRKRQLYKLFPGNKDLMRKLFKEKHQHRFRKEDDLIRITEILNSMFK